MELGYLIVVVHYNNVLVDQVETSTSSILDVQQRVTPAGLPVFLSRTMDAVQCASISSGLVLLEHLELTASLSLNSASGLFITTRELDISGITLRRNAARLQSVLRVHPASERILSVLPVYVTVNDVVTPHLLVHLHGPDFLQDKAMRRREMANNANSNRSRKRAISNTL